MVCPRVLVCLLEDQDTSGHGATFSTTFPPTSRRVLLGSYGQCTTARILLVNPRRRLKHLPDVLLCFW